MRARSTAAPTDNRSWDEGREEMHILLVEGNTDAAQTLSLLLKLMGHDVRVAHTGPAGLDAVREQPPDAVFAAISLPGAMDGYELARQFRAHPDRGKMLV